LTRAKGWLARRPSLLYLLAGEQALAGLEPRRFKSLWAGLTALSLGCGLVLCGLWGLAWALFFEPGDWKWILPTVAVTLAAWLLGPLRQPFVSLLDLRGGRPGPSRSLLATVLTVALALCLLTFHADRQRWEVYLPPYLAWLRPTDKLYRVLLLMPLWGAWSMLIAPQFCRPRPSTDAPTAAFARGCGALTAAACLVLPLAGTLFYFHYLGLRGQLVIAAVSVLGAIASGLACCRLAGGLCRKALLAANLLAQLVFLLAFLAWRGR
jgi:hypothetical protein